MKLERKTFKAERNEGLAVGMRVLRRGNWWANYRETRYTYYSNSNGFGSLIFDTMRERRDWSYVKRAQLGQFPSKNRGTIRSSGETEAPVSLEFQLDHRWNEILETNMAHVFLPRPPPPNFPPTFNSFRMRDALIVFVHRKFVDRSNRVTNYVVDKSRLIQFAKERAAWRGGNKLSQRSLKTSLSIDEFIP